MSMRVVIDGLPVRGMSLGIVIEQILGAWEKLGNDDDIHVVLASGSGLKVPQSMTVHQVEVSRNRLVNRLYGQNVVVAKLCRSLNADILFGVNPSTTITPVPCSRVIMSHDQRHEFRPEQFTLTARLVRRISYNLGFIQAQAIACVSERTKRDLLSTHPKLRNKLVRVIHHGTDHVDLWPSMLGDQEYAIAFGHYGHKNIDLVIDAWSHLNQQGKAMQLVLTGLPESARASVQSKLRDLGLDQIVSTLSWLPSEKFQEYFVSSSLVVFPSDFEGFGLPVVEAMRLGIPIVITSDPALLEVSGGLVTVVTGNGAIALAESVLLARQTSAVELETAKAHAGQYTWKRSASQLRSLFVDSMGIEQSDPMNW